MHPATQTETHPPTNHREMERAEATACLNSEQTTLLQSACVELIGSIELLLEQAQGERKAGYLGEAASVGNQILLTLFQFAENHLNDQALEQTVEVISQGYETTKKTIELSTSQSWGTIRKIIGQKIATHQEIAEAYAKCGFAIATATEVAVNHALDLFGDDADLVAQMRESLHPILSDMRSDW